MNNKMTVGEAVIFGHIAGGGLNTKKHELDNAEKSGFNQATSGYKAIIEAKDKLSELKEIKYQQQITNLLILLHINQLLAGQILEEAKKSEYSKNPFEFQNFVNSLPARRERNIALSNHWVASLDNEFKFNTVLDYNLSNEIWVTDKNGAVVKIQLDQKR